MNRTPKMWEILAAFIPVVSGIVIWLWNIGVTVKEHGKDIEYIKASQVQYMQNVKEINDKLTTILIRLENKKDRE